MLAQLVTVALSIQAPAPSAAAALATAVPICPNGVAVPSDQPCPLPPPAAQFVFFAPGDARLSAEGRATLEGVADRLHAEPSLRVLVLGFAQEGPDAAAIDRLSRARAQAVVDGLIGLGTRFEQIASGEGGAERSAAAADQSDPYDRRAEILFAQGSGPFIDAFGEFVTPEAPAPGPASPAAQDPLAGELPFQNSFVEWEFCHRISAVESARRAGRAGPGRAADYSGISDCAREYERLVAIVQLLPDDGRREQAAAMIERAGQNIAALAEETYARNNYE